MSVFDKIAVIPETGCWEYQGARHTEGYGKVHVEGRPRLAHRAAWAEVHGDAGALFVLHKCDNRPCINPDHLFLGTQADNVRDMIAKGRRVNPTPRHGTLSPHAKITEAEALAIHQLHATGRWSYADLGRKFGLHRGTVGQIVRGERWPHIASVAV